MNPILRNTLAVLAGLVIGNVVNMGIITISSSIIPPPEGMNPQDLESLKEHMQLFEAKHFLMPFLAHALGTLVGAFVVALLANTNKLRLAIFIGILFFVGGLTMVFMLPSPIWFAAVDLILAYIPMAWIGYKLAAIFKSVDVTML
jgi:hypothetical protein